MTTEERKEIYLNARKAYRLLYSVQDSIHGMALYLNEKLDCTNEVIGKRIFSDSIHLSQSRVADYSREQFYEGQWGWDYFPSYLYNYYYTLDFPEDRYCGFSMTAVMDDGSKFIKKGEPEPTASDFLSVRDSESYYLFSCCSCLRGEQTIYYDSMTKWKKNQEKFAMFKVADEIKASGINPFVKGNDKSMFIAWKVPMESIGTRKDIDDLLESCDSFIFEKFKIHILKNRS